MSLIPKGWEKGGKLDLRRCTTPHPEINPGFTQDRTIPYNQPPVLRLQTMKAETSSLKLVQLAKVLERIIPGIT